MLILSEYNPHAQDRSTVCASTQMGVILRKKLYGFASETAHRGVFLRENAPDKEGYIALFRTVQYDAASGVKRPQTRSRYRKATRTFSSGRFFYLFTLAKCGDPAPCKGVSAAQISRGERNDYHGNTVDRAPRIVDVLGVRFLAEAPKRDVYWGYQMSPSRTALATARAREWTCNFA